MESGVNKRHKRRERQARRTDAARAPLGTDWPSRNLTFRCGPSAKERQAEWFERAPHDLGTVSLSNPPAGNNQSSNRAKRVSALPGYPVRTLARVRAVTPLQNASRISNRWRSGRCTWASCRGLGRILERVENPHEKALSNIQAINRTGRKIHLENSKDPSERSGLLEIPTNKPGGLEPGAT